MGTCDNEAKSNGFPASGGFRAILGIQLKTNWEFLVQT
jgi:hypothetical protein